MAEGKAVLCGAYDLRHDFEKPCVAVAQVSSGNESSPKNFVGKCVIIRGVNK